MAAMSSKRMVPLKISVVVTEPVARATNPLVTVKSPESKRDRPLTKVLASWMVMVPAEAVALAMVTDPTCPLTAVTPVPVPSASVAHSQAVLVALRLMI